MVLTLKLNEPTALAAGCTLVYFSINSGPKLALTVHKVSAIWLAPCRSLVIPAEQNRRSVPYLILLALPAWPNEIILAMQTSFIAVRAGFK